VNETERDGLVASNFVSERIGIFTVTAALAFGPRLVGLRKDAGTEILASLDKSVGIPRDDGSVYRFHGGHRLWAGPEIPEITYGHDDSACTVASSAGEMSITGPIDDASFSKHIRVSAHGDGLLVEHQLTWHGQVPVVTAPWAITQFPLDGTAILRIAGRNSENAVQADRSLVMWPYTNLGDERLGFHEHHVLIKARPGPALKLGAGPDPGTLAYLREGSLFTKSFESKDGHTYPDLGAVGQIYTNESFCELESIGPLVSLMPGESANHAEIWQVIDCDDIESALILASGETA
jgi:hypothetical protein